jgi:glycolate oxidase
VQDGVVPRTRIAATLHYINETSRKYGLTISNIFHAGDGNMHPIILFDARRKGELERARSAGEEILAYCVENGGSITGEHGVGMEKNELMARQFPPETLETMAKLKALFDPDGRLNPGKVLPTGRGCLEIRQKPLAAGQPAL